MKHFRKITAVAAAAVLAVPLSLGVLAGCGRDSGNGNISVYINCNDADATAYQNLIDAWEVEYANKLKAADPETYGADFTITVDFTPEPDADTYTGNAKRWLQSGTAQDILYVSPGMVQMYVNNGYIADLSDKLVFEQYNIGDLWGGALGRYAYNTNDGSIGLPVEYDSSTGAFYQNGDKSKQVGVYALPKDYSSFSYAYNANFFSDDFKSAYENTTDKFGAVYVYGTTPDPGEFPRESSTAQAAPIIDIGTTVTYYPFNFYNYHTLEAAYKAGDPVAVMSVNNGGYDITLPGYPDQTFTNGTDSADNYTVKSEDIMAKLAESAGKFGGELVNGKYAACMFESVDDKFTEVNIKAEDKFSLTSEIVDKSWWDKLWGLSGNVTSIAFDGIKAIYPVTDSDLAGTDEEVSERLFISSADVADFKQFYNAEKADSTVYLFRYQVSDYIAQEVTEYKHIEDWALIGGTFNTYEVVDTNAYFFQETVNLDFDIIDVTFSTGETETVIPVVSSPIDVIPDATAPVYTESDEEPAWLKWLKAIVAAVIIVVILVIFGPLIFWLLKLVIKIILWPFKAIVKLFKGR